MKDQVLIAAGLAALVFISWRLVVALSNKPAQKRAFVLSPDVLLKPKPLFNEAELLLYNLIRLAVQDQYLVFARVPLWCVLQVEAEGQTRLNLLRHLLGGFLPRFAGANALRLASALTVKSARRCSSPVR